jgi:ApaG protein
MVDGDGVVGETPLIEPGQKYIYNSGCNLSTEIGKMDGYYTVRNEITMQEFSVKIPEFYLVSPSKMN